MAKYHLQGLIVRVTSNGQDTYTGALGESMTGVPATIDMQVRNGFVAYSYLTTMLLQFVNQKKIRLDDKLSKYLPDLPEANAVTIKMLANSTSGYADYVYQPALSDGLYRDPFRQWATVDLIKIGMSAPATFPPGTNWAYSHTNYAILGTVLAKVGGKPVGQLMTQYIFGPMGLKHTQWSDTPQIPEPVLHTFSSERRETLGIAPSTPFYEDSTFCVVDRPRGRLTDHRHRRPDHVDPGDRVWKAALARVLSRTSRPEPRRFRPPGPRLQRVRSKHHRALLRAGGHPAGTVDHREQVLRGQRGGGRIPTV
jgi:CubicO group peptidase (beta-lactamase class C family)